MRRFLKLYGTGEYGDERHKILGNLEQIDFEKAPTIISPSIYCVFENEEFFGVNGSYVDKSLRKITDNDKLNQ